MSTHKEYVYLAGPMEHCKTVEEMKGWRRTATGLLEMEGIRTLDPTRRVSFHDQLYEGGMSSEQRTHNISKRIFKLDMQDIANSTVILADVRRGTVDGPRIGTSMELMHAHHKHKIIIMWGDIHDKPHPFYVAIATEFCTTLEEAVAAVAEYYNH